MVAFNQGRVEAQNEILKRFYKTIVQFAKGLIENQEESEEIADDIFINLFRKYSDFKTLLNIRAYLFVSTRNACLNRIQAKKTEIKRLGRKISLSDYKQAENIPELTSEQPPWVFREAELIERIRIIVRVLPPMCREIFIRHYFNGEGVNDIARDLGVSPATVSKQRKIGIAKVRASLGLIMLIIICFIIQFFVH